MTASHYNLGQFAYRGGELFCEDVPVARIAAEAGTPVYIYSKNTLLDRFSAVREAFGSDATVCFSVKSCGSLGVLAALAGAGCGFDVVSGGEIFRVKKAGGDTAKVVYAGVGKTDREIRFALENRILLFNVESAAELANLNRIAGETGVKAPVGLRLNPDVDAKTHAKTTTGKKENKFGIDPATASRLLADAAAYPHVVFNGIDAHIGSPVNSVEPYAKAAEKLADFILRHRSAAAPLEYMDTGGGFGLLYRDEPTPTFADYAAAIVPHVRRAGCRLLVEPGRSIAGNAAILVAQTQYRKTTDVKNFAILDAGMMTLIRPAMYDSYHFIWPVLSREPPPHVAFGGAREGLRLVKTDVVGPVCESSDVFAKDRELPELDRGDLVAIFSAGAYGFSMSSEYNAHPRPAEVLVDGENWRIIRRRQTWDDLIAGETI